MMKNYRVFCAFKRMFVELVVWVTLLWGLAPLYSHSATFYKCPGVDGIPQFQQTRCSRGVELRLHANTLPWREAAALKKRKAIKTKPKAPKKVNQKKSAVACWRAEKRRDKASRALRKGYKPAQGERLRVRRREAEEYLHRFCR